MSISELEKICNSNGMKYTLKEPMSRHTSFKTGGNADIFIIPKSANQLRNVIEFSKENTVPFFVIGNGSNLLISDRGVEGAVISLKELNGIKKLNETEIYCEAGVPLSALCNFAYENGLSGLEFAYGIPGSVGGAVYMNAGAYGGEMKDVTVSVSGLNKQYNVSEFDFGYRKSVFKTNGDIIISAVFSLKTAEKSEIRARMDELINRRILKQPLDFPSAGSTFKRPDGYYAAALIEECGLKGKTFGGAQVSEKHAGFIINRDKATSDDIITLIKNVQNTVFEKRGVTLETEVIFKGRE